MGKPMGLLKIHLDGRRDKILGATVVARHAGEMINEITLAMEKGLGLGAIASVIHPYPTQAEVIRKAADDYSFSRFTPFVKKLAATWLRWAKLINPLLASLRCQRRCRRGKSAVKSPPPHLGSDTLSVLSLHPPAFAHQP